MKIVPNQEQRKKTKNKFGVSTKGAYMNKKIFLVIAVVLLICITCSQKKDETRVIDQKVIEKVAKISAMFDSNEDIAVDMLKKEEISAQEYSDIITAIALDEKATNTFVQMKKIHTEEFQKQ